MRKIILYLIVLPVMLTILPGCGGSATGGKPVEELIVGTWQFNRGGGGIGMTEIYEFGADGSVTNRVQVSGALGMHNDPPNNGKYVITGNKLTIDTDMGQTLSYTIEFLDPNRLKIEKYIGTSQLFQRVRSD